MQSTIESRSTGRKVPRWMWVAVRESTSVLEDDSCRAMSLDLRTQSSVLAKNGIQAFPVTNNSELPKT